MAWSIEYAYSDVEQFILRLSPKLAAKYLHLTDLMLEFGAHLGMPHTRSMSDGLFELRIRGKEGIARVFYCTLAGKRIIMLHAFVKKSRKTPAKEIKIALCRLSEVKSNESR